MTPTHNQSTLLTVVAAALLVAACGGSDTLQSPLSPTAVTGGTAAALAGDPLQASTPDTAIAALGKGGGRSGGDGEKKGGDDKGKSGTGGGSGADDGRAPSGDREPKRESVNMSGRVTAVSAVSLTVRELEVTVSALTVIRHGNRMLTLADIRIGDQVQVKGVQVDGVIVASEVKVEDLGRDQENDDDEVSRVELEDEAEGLTSVPSGACPTLAFYVGATPVTTSSTTVFHGVTCEQIAAGVVVNVDVDGRRMADGSLAATVVELD